MQATFRADSLALANTGNKIAAKIAIIPITTNSSTSVNPRLFILSVQDTLIGDKWHPFSTLFG